MSEPLKTGGESTSVVTSAWPPVNWETNELWSIDSFSSTTEVTVTLPPGGIEPSSQR